MVCHLNKTKNRFTAKPQTAVRLSLWRFQFSTDGNENSHTSFKCLTICKKRSEKVQLVASLYGLNITHACKQAWREQKSADWKRANPFVFLVSLWLLVSLKYLFVLRSVLNPSKPYGFGAFLFFIPHMLYWFHTHSSDCLMVSFSDFDFMQ